MTKASPENKILAKGNNSCKSSSNATKVELDLYYIKTIPYAKFQVNITKDRREMHLPNFRSLSQKTEQKNSENTIFAKGNN